MRECSREKGGLEGPAEALGSPVCGRVSEEGQGPARPQAGRRGSHSLRGRALGCTGDCFELTLNLAALSSCTSPTSCCIYM